MRGILFLLVTVTAFGLQVEAKRDGVDVDRGLSDVWETVKNSIQNAFKTIQDMLERTKDKINKWAQEVKERAKSLADEFQRKVEDMKQKSKELLEKLVGEEGAQKIEECFKKERDAEDLIRQLITNVTICISNSIMNLRDLDRYEARSDSLNEIDFLTELENKINKCVKANETEYCIVEARKDVLSYIDVNEKDIFNESVISRGIIDDIYDKAVLCTYEGLIKASQVIAEHTVQIILCVSEAIKENPNDKIIYLL